MKKRLLAVLLASLIGLAGCSSKSGDPSSSSTTSAASSSPSESSSTESSDVAIAPTEVPTFSGFDPAKGMSNEEIVKITKEAYEGTGEYTADKLPTVTIETTMGAIKIRLFPRFAPKAVENFITHAKNGYYENIKFHRVINDFMIQGGDPKGTGTGGESIWEGAFEDEFNPLLHNFRGALSMANSGANTNGSQFFIVQGPKEVGGEDFWAKVDPIVYRNRLLYEAYSRLISFVEGKNLDPNTAQQDPELTKAMESVQADLDTQIAAGVPDAFLEQQTAAKEIYEKVGGSAQLDNKHTVFGYVYEGMDIVDKIAAVETDEANAPKENVLIKKITVTEPAGTAAAETSSTQASSGQATASEASSSAASSSTASTSSK